MDNIKMELHCEGMDSTKFTHDSINAGSCKTVGWSGGGGVSSYFDQPDRGVN